MLEEETSCGTDMHMHDALIGGDDNQDLALYCLYAVFAAAFCACLRSAHTAGCKTEQQTSQDSLKQPRLKCNACDSYSNPADDVQREGVHADIHCQRGASMCQSRGIIGCCSARPTHGGVCGSLSVVRPSKQHDE